MEVTTEYVFQTDSDIVLHSYCKQDNFLIEYDDTLVLHEFCAIYFSSNEVYYPNNEETFKKQIVDRNYFEWYRLRVDKAHKHIFVRDIFKQWYIAGINSTYNSFDKVLAFLKQETVGYKVITLGSSAGGYAAVLYGSFLNAQLVMSFNGQFEVNSLITKSNPKIDPLLFRKFNTDVATLYDIKPLVSSAVDVFYFNSLNSDWDSQQKRHIEDLSQIKVISFKTSHHGIPFLKCNLPIVINMESDSLRSLSQKEHHPLLFSIKSVGIWRTYLGFKEQFLLLVKKKFRLI